jgi:hypothetical protein
LYNEQDRLPSATARRAANTETRHNRFAGRLSSAEIHCCWPSPKIALGDSIAVHAPSSIVAIAPLTATNVCPQWQGAGSSEVRALAPQSPIGVTRRGYTVGTAVLDAVLSASGGPTTVVLG